MLLQVLITKKDFQSKKRYTSQLHYEKEWFCEHFFFRNWVDNYILERRQFISVIIIVFFYEGEPGDEGFVGLPGMTGLQGRKGEPGFNGRKGEQGDFGLQGEIGFDGRPGKICS